MATPAPPMTPKVSTRAGNDVTKLVRMKPIPMTIPPVTQTIRGPTLSCHLPAATITRANVKIEAVNGQLS